MVAPSIWPRVLASGLEGVLEMAIVSSSKSWSPRDPGRALSSDRTHGCRESPLGSKAYPGRIGKVRVSGFREDRGQIYASVWQPTGTWREFLTRHASDIWACDFFCVPTVSERNLEELESRHIAGYVATDRAKDTVASEGANEATEVATNSRQPLKAPTRVEAIVAMLVPAESASVTRGTDLDSQIVPWHLGRLIIRACGTLGDADSEGRPFVEEQRVEVVVVDGDDHVGRDVF
jgi:hypothetical protein